MISERGTLGEFNIGQVAVAKIMRPILDTLSVELGEAYEPKLQLGKWITREIFLGYEHNFRAADLENQAEAIVRYRFLPGWMIESRIGDKAQGLDLFWTKRF